MTHENLRPISTAVMTFIVYEQTDIKAKFMYCLIHVFKTLILNSKIFSLYDFTIFFKIKES